MGGEKLSYNNDMGLKNDQWVFMETRNGGFETESNGSTCGEDSILSSSSSDIQLDDDATSSSSTSSSNSGPLFELSQLMDHLPIKRGLSNFYHGKSQSFTSLASVKSVEDLAKKEDPNRKRVKPCEKFRPKGNITKKCCSRSSNFVSLVGKRGTSSCRLAVSVVQKQHL